MAAKILLSLDSLRRWLLLLLLVGLTLWAGRCGLAAIYAYPAQLLLDFWSSQQHEQTDRTNDRWQSALEALRKAQALLPQDAQLYFLAGQLHHYQAIRKPGWTESSKQHWQQSIQAYRTALRLRPMWGYLWGVLAQAELQSAAPTNQVLADWQKAIHFAPHSFATGHVTLQIGFAYWPTLDDSARQTVKEAIALLFPEQGDRIIPLASQFNRLELLQPYLQQNPQWHKQFIAAQQAG
jgi:tetratricopeptide (TPR) repeat protein